MWQVVLLAVGFATGIVAALFGVGGGIIFVPALILLLGFSPVAAVATSLEAILMTSSSAALGYYKRGLVDARSGVIILAFSMPSAIAGAYLASVLPGDVVRVSFSVLLFLVAASIYRGRRFRVPRRALPPLASLAGLVSGFLGIGGGVIFVPLLFFALNKGIKESVATSSFMIVLTSTSGLVTHALLGNVDFVCGLLLGLSAIVGAQAGVRMGVRARSSSLRKAFAVFLSAVSVRLLFL